MPKRFLFLLLLLFAQPLTAGSPLVREWSVERDLDGTYQAVYKALEDNNFFVVFEVDMQANLSRFAERWGEDYNRNDLEGIRAMVFCNGWYANQVSNRDPALLVLCPLHLTVIHKAGKSTVQFLRPSHVARGSAAEAVATELEAAVVKAIEQGIAP